MLLSLPAKTRLCLGLLLCTAAHISGAQAASKPAARTTQPAPARQALKAGQTRAFAGGLTINFVAVTEDSRCPADARCVWAGNARVSLRVRDQQGKVHLVAVNTGLEPRRATVGGQSIALTSLTPHPTSTAPIDKKAYVATLEVARQAAASAPPGAWQALFGSDPWYQEASGQEQIFTGRLEAVKADPNLVTTLMRTSYYQLNGRLLYTATHRHPLLEKLTGRQVQVRGKVVDMELEGRTVKEIWPAAIRALPQG